MVENELGDLRRLANQRALTLHSQAYTALATGNLYYTVRPTLRTNTSIPGTNRRTAVTAFRLLTQHCRLNSHLKLLSIVSSNKCTHCQSRAAQTVAHILFKCTAFNAQRQAFINVLNKNKTRHTLIEVLKNKQTLLAAANFVNNIRIEL